MIDKFVSVLRAARLEPTAEEVADALWLASLAISMAGSQNAKSRKTTRANAQASMRESSSPKSQRRKSTQAGSEAPHGELHQAAGQPSSASTNKRGVAMASPTASALPGALELARALRPLKRRVPSRVHFEVDEEATAQRIAERLPDPLVVRPLRTRWLNLTLLVDEGPSMPIWQQTVRELQALMSGHGAFGRVKRCGFIAEGPSEPHLYARSGRGLRTVGPRELIDPAGRQLVLVVSDCVSRGWHDGRIAELLGVWARRGPVGLLQVLPPRLWQRSALGAALPVRLRSDHPAASNVQLIVEKNDWWFEDDSAPNTQLPIPVFCIERASIEAWTNLIAGRTSNPAGGVLFSGKIDTEYWAESPDDVVTSDARSRVSHFRATSSLNAQKLATYFASAHYLSLPVMRLIHQRMMPDATLGHLAEVFLAGLLHEVTDGDEDPEYVRYYFVAGVRELLLNAAEEESIRKVLTAVSDYTTAHLGHKTSFRAILADSDGYGGEVIPEHEASFARIGAEVLRRLGGEYQRIADRIGTRLDVVSSRAVYRSESETPMLGFEYDTKLVEYAREYEIIRDRNMLIRKRMAQLEHLFVEIRDYVISTDVGSSITVGAFHLASEGLRAVALAIIDATQNLAGFDVIHAAIAESKSPFEQYYALRVVSKLLPRLTLHQRLVLRNAILHQRSGVPGTMLQPESDQWWLSEDLLQQLDAPHQIVAALGVARRSHEAAKEFLPAKYGRRTSAMHLVTRDVVAAFEVVKPFRLPFHSGSMLRGVLGRSLRVAGCARGATVCNAECEAPSQCTYTRLFDPIVPKSPPPFLRGQTRAPQPLIPIFPKPGAVDMAKGSEFSFALRLLGPLRPGETDIVLATLEGLNVFEFGEERGRIAFDDARIQPLQEMSIAADGESVIAERIEIVFETPAWIESSGQLMEKMVFRSFFRSIYRRLTVLCKLYGEVNENSDELFRELDALAENIAVTTNDLKPLAWNRRSVAREREHPLHGLLGRVVFEGKGLGSFIEVLQLASRTHVGKATSHGLGRMRIAGIG